MNAIVIGGAALAGSLAAVGGIQGAKGQRVHSSSSRCKLDDRAGLHTALQGHGIKDDGTLSCHMQIRGRNNQGSLHTRMPVQAQKRATGRRVVSEWDDDEDEEEEEESDDDDDDDDDTVEEKERNAYVVDINKKTSIGVLSLGDAWWKRMAMEDAAATASGEVIGDDSLREVGRSKHESSGRSAMEENEPARSYGVKIENSQMEDPYFYGEGIVEDDAEDPNWDDESESGRGFRYSDVFGEVQIIRNKTVGDYEDDYDEHEDDSDWLELERRKRFREIGMADWEELTFDPSPLILCAFSRWCGPCSTMCREVEKGANTIWEQGKLRLRAVKLEINKEPDLAAALEVDMHPTVFFIEDGKVLNKMEFNEKDMISADDLLQFSAHFFYGGPKPARLTQFQKKRQRGRPAKPRDRVTISEEAERRALLKRDGKPERHQYLYVAPEGRRRPKRSGSKPDFES